LVTTLGSGSGSSSYTVSSLTAGTAYTFYLRNGNTSGSNQLATVTCSTQAIPCTPYYNSASGKNCTQVCAEYGKTCKNISAQYPLSGACTTTYDGYYHAFSGGACSCNTGCSNTLCYTQGGASCSTIMYPQTCNMYCDGLTCCNGGGTLLNWGVCICQ
jgi:hypothetical protein